MASLTISLYKSLVIPILNHIIHRLSTYSFKSVLKHRPQYISDFTIESAEADSHHCQLSEGGPIFLGYADPWLEWKQPRSEPVEDPSHGMKNGYLNALYAITVSDINPVLVNAATYQAYLNICKLLRIYIPLAHLPGKCGVCFTSVDECECYQYRFTFIQYIKCSCRYGKYGSCICDVYPEIFCDLDEIRGYQCLVANKVLSDLIEWCTEDDEPPSVVYYPYRFIDVPARRSDDRYNPRLIRILERFRPP